MIKRELKEVSVEVKILGYKGHITAISSQLADAIWRKDDTIIVWITFNEPVGSTLSFAVELPVKEYTRDEFLKAVKREADIKLGLIMKGDQARGEAQRRTDEKQGELNSAVSNISQVLTRQ